jgi:hypothetical protein
MEQKELEECPLGNDFLGSTLLEAHSILLSENSQYS